MTAVGFPVLAPSRVIAVLACAGWQIKTAEIDTANSTARIEVFRDGRHVILDVRNGRASITRETWHFDQVTIGRRGDRFVTCRVTPRLLGRERFGSPRDALRCFAEYIVDNGNARLSGSSLLQLMLAPCATTP